MPDCSRSNEAIPMFFSWAAIVYLPENGRFLQHFGDAAIFGRLLQSLPVAAEDAAYQKKSLNASESIVMLFQFVFIIGQLPFCFKMADLSDFGGCCKFWQVAAKPFGCFKTYKIDQ